LGLRIQLWPTPALSIEFLNDRFVPFEEVLVSEMNDC
jgi:hypothetical protein